jgi:hypothetical protein
MAELMANRFRALCRRVISEIRYTHYLWLLVGLVIGYAQVEDDHEEISTEGKAGAPRPSRRGSPPASAGRLQGLL